MVGELHHPQYNCKTVKEWDFREIMTPLSTVNKKCLALDGTVIFPDKECTQEETLKDTSEMRDWLRKVVRDVFADNDEKQIHNVQMSFSKTKGLSVVKINDKVLSENPTLTDIEKKIVKEMTQMPTKLLDGVYRKIGLHEVDYIFSIPIYWGNIV